MTVRHSKNLREAYELMKSEGWIIYNIDWVPSLYKKLSDKYDVEVSGLNNAKTVNYEARVYVWQIKGGLQTVETIKGIKSLENLAGILREIEAKYTNM